MDSDKESIVVCDVCVIGIINFLTIQVYQGAASCPDQGILTIFDR